MLPLTFSESSRKRVYRVLSMVEMHRQVCYLGRALFLKMRQFFVGPKHFVSLSMRWTNTPDSEEIA